MYLCRVLANVPVVVDIEEMDGRQARHNGQADEDEGLAAGGVAVNTATYKANAGLPLAGGE
jgi:hypothetical protein